MQRPFYPKESSRISAYKAPPRSHHANKREQAASFQQRDNYSSSFSSSPVTGRTSSTNGTSVTLSPLPPPSHLRAPDASSWTPRGTSADAPSLSHHNAQASSSSSPLRGFCISESGRQRARETAKTLSRAHRADLLARSRREALGFPSNSGSTSLTTGAGSGLSATKHSERMVEDHGVSDGHKATALDWDSDDSDAGLTEREKEEKENELIYAIWRAEMQRERERLAADSKEHTIDPDRIEEYMQLTLAQSSGQKSEQVPSNATVSGVEASLGPGDWDSMGDEWAEADDAVLVREMERIDPSRNLQDADVDMG